MDHITVIPNDNEVPRPTSHISKMVEQLIALYDNPEEGKKRAEFAFNMVHSNLIWDTHITPQWVDLFDSIETGPGSVEHSPDAPVLAGDLL